MRAVVSENVKSESFELRSKTQSTPWYRYFLRFSNIIYTFSACFLFGAYAYNHNGILYALCSFAMNIGVAWFFSGKAFKSLRRIVKKKEIFFNIAFTLSFFLSFGTMAAGFEVAKKSANNVSFIRSNPILHFIAVGISLFNTLSTRLVGSTYFLFAFGHWCRDIYRWCWTQYGAYYQLRNDIQQYSQYITMDIDFAMAEDWEDSYFLRIYAGQLLLKIEEQNLRLQNRWKSKLETFGRIIATGLIVNILMLNIVPLWIYMAVKGVEKMPSFFHSEGLIFCAAVASEMFYLNSGRRFMSIMFIFLKRAYTNIKNQCANRPCPKFFNSFFSVSIICLFLLGTGTMAYFSGEGYGNEAREAMDKNFGDMANHLWFPWMGWWTNFFISHYDQIATISAGVIVNGSAFIEFCLRSPCLHAEKPSYHSRALSILDKAIKSGEFKELEAASVRDIVEHYNPKPTNIVRSFWGSCLNKRKETQKEIALSKQFTVN